MKFEDIIPLHGYGSGDGYGYGYGYGSGSGSGSGDGYGSGYGSGSGYGYSGSGSGSGDGSGDGPYYAKIWGVWYEVAGELENSLCINIQPMHLDKIDKTFVQKVNNLESLRALREKIGLEKYLSFFDAKLIDVSTDKQGNQMRLYKYDEKGTEVIILEVVCPSTMRMYHLYPPDQSVRTCAKAKASTFANKPIKYRHGDCGIMEVDKIFEYPIHES